MSRKKLSEMSLMEVLNMLNDDNQNSRDWASAINDLAYRGFNPRAFRLLVEAIEEDPNKLMHDIEDLLSLFLMRGSKISKIAGKSNPETWAKYKKACEKYGVVDNLPRVGDTTKVITLGRVCNAFPEIALYCMVQIPKRFEGIKSRLPSVLRFAAAAALIPSDDHILIQQHKKFCEDVDRVLNKNQSLSSKAQLDNFWNASHSSDLYSNAERLEALIAVGVKEKTDESESGSAEEGDGGEPSEGEGATITAVMAPPASSSTPIITKSKRISKRGASSPSKEPIKKFK